MSHVNPITDEWWERRRRALWIGWIVAGLGVAIGVGGVVLAIQTDRGEFCFGLLLGLIVALVGGIYGSAKSRMVTAKEIDDHYVWLKGVHPDYVAALPGFPLGQRGR